MPRKTKKQQIFRGMTSQAAEEAIALWQELGMKRQEVSRGQKGRRLCGFTGGQLPIPSMYGMFPYIYHKNQPFM